MTRGIDRQQGWMVIVRRDQYVAYFPPLTDVEALSAYFDQLFAEKAG